MTSSPARIHTKSFSGLGINSRLLRAIAALNFTEPTPVQLQAIPVGLEGRDLIAIAQTGTGKTLAFGVPMIQRLLENNGRGLIIVPTRELALQVDAALRDIGRSQKLRTAVLIGGASMSLQLRDLKQRPRIIIVTPGRMIDHLERKTISLADIQMLVLDEADRMLDMGFAPQINKILKVVPKDRQTMLFSATMPDEIASLASRFMHDPVTIEIARSGTTAEKVTQQMYFVEKKAKVQLLDHLLADSTGPVLVFTRTKYTAKTLARRVLDMGHATADIHSNRSLAQRRNALDGFKSGKYRVLVATDIAARGIDVTGIEMVVNYDLPTNSEDYVHRIGRTGRAGLIGRAVSFATRDQQKEVRGIERLIRSSVPVTALPILPPVRAKSIAEPPSERRGERRPARPAERRPTTKQSKPSTRPRKPAGKSPRRRSRSPRR
jgi:ATP-dependent RNA helicase RhlE